MKRHFIVAGVSALCMALAPTVAFGTETSPPPPVVGQTNSAPASAAAGNANTSGQFIGQSGGGSQSADQTAINTQLIPIAAAPATTVQTLPINANVPVRVASPGDNGSVKQSNKAPADASASNLNGSKQAIGQNGAYGGGSQSAHQKAINTQLLPIALAPATALQTVPLNANAPVRFLDELPRLPVDPFAVLADPVKTVGGALPVDAFGLLASPTDALGALPLGTVTALLPALPIGGLV